MSFIYRVNITIVMTLLFISSPVLLAAGEPTERIKATTDKLIEIITNPELEPPEMKEERDRMIREAVDKVFDWAAFSQRAMGRHWRDLNNTQKKEFIELFSKLIEQTYMDKTRQYSGEKIEFLNENIDAKFGSVESKVILENSTEVIVEYRIRKREEVWFIYDVYVEGVSLVNNYRGQFNEILTKYSYEELVKRLKSKLEDVG